LKVELTASRPSLRLIDVFALQVVKDANSTDWVARWEKARVSQLVDAVPEVEVFERPVREILTLRNPSDVSVALNQCNRNASLPKLYRECRADGTPANDDDLIPVCHCPHLQSWSSLFERNATRRAGSSLELDAFYKAIIHSLALTARSAELEADAPSATNGKWHATDLVALNCCSGGSSLVQTSCA
jgi:hypothetical protein